MLYAKMSDFRVWHFFCYYTKRMSCIFGGWTFPLPLMKGARGMFIPQGENDRKA